MISYKIFNKTMIIKMENCSLFDRTNVDMILSLDELDDMDNIIIIDVRTFAAMKSKLINDSIDENINKFRQKIGDKLTIYDNESLNSKKPIKTDYGYIHPCIIRGRILLIEDDSPESLTPEEIYCTLLYDKISKEGL